MIPSNLRIRLTVLALLAAFVLLPSALRADTVTYTLASTDTLAGDLGSITGSFTVNTSNGTMLATGTLVADGKTFTCNNCVMFSPGGILSLEGFEPVAPGGAYLVLGWSKLPADPTQLIFTTSGPGFSYCAGCLARGLDFLSAGDFAVDPVPEPSTALLLVSGLSLLPFVRRRRLKA